MVLRGPVRAPLIRPLLACVVVGCAAQLAALRDPGAGERVKVRGDAAQVRLAVDTLFLLRFPDGRRVRAAGQRGRPEAGPVGELPDEEFLAKNFPTGR